MGTKNTKDRIVKAAEQLFADSGFFGTSLRNLTSMADVNLAAVNYHFGSKENLIREVFKRRLDVLNHERREALNLLEQEFTLEPPPLNRILEAFIFPAMLVSARSGGAGSPFVRVLARAFVEYHSEFRAFLSEQYGDLNRRFFLAIAANLDHLNEQEIFWRIDFMIGSLTYAMADFGISKCPPGSEQKTYWERAANQLVQFAMAGLTAASQSMDRDSAQ